MRSTVVRLTNPYGVGQPAGRVAYGIVNRLIQLALDDQPLPVYGDGAQRRDYIYVDDVVDALLGIGVEHGDGWAACTTSGAAPERRSSTWREWSWSCVGAGRVVFEPWPALAGQIETGDFVADISRLAGALGWRPQTSLCRGAPKDDRQLQM